VANPFIVLQAVLYESSLLFKDTLTNHLRAFRLGDLVTLGEDLSGEGVKFRVITTSIVSSE
jgi:hypothetical protein